MDSYLKVSIHDVAPPSALTTPSRTLGLGSPRKRIIGPIRRREWNGTWSITGNSLSGDSSNCKYAIRLESGLHQ